MLSLANLRYQDPKVKARVDSALAPLGIEYHGTTKVKHLLRVLTEDVGVERIRTKVVRPLGGLKIGAFYGCHLLRPADELDWESAEEPHAFEDLLTAVGATPVYAPGPRDVLRVPYPVREARHREPHRRTTRSTTRRPTAPTRWPPPARSVTSRSTPTRTGPRRRSATRSTSRCSTFPRSWALRSGRPRKNSASVVISSRLVPPSPRSGPAPGRVLSGPAGHAALGTHPRGGALSRESGRGNVADAEEPMRRPSVPEADALIGVRQPVLSHGFVALVDYMGNDAAIVQAARVSYGQGTKTLRDDRALIRYLMRHQHTTPFEMVEFKFLVRLPIYVARQFIRHRTASVNEYSARYSVVPDEYQIPAPEEVRRQSTLNRQGRGETLPSEVVEKFRTDLERLSKETYTAYTAALTAGVARETARLLLPVAYYTQWYWKANLHNLLHFLLLRLDPHAQEEIRLFAAEMAKIGAHRRPDRLRGVRGVPALGAPAEPARAARGPPPARRPAARGRVRGRRPTPGPRGRAADEDRRRGRVPREARTDPLRRMSRGERTPPSPSVRPERLCRDWRGPRATPPV